VLLEQVAELGTFPDPDGATAVAARDVRSLPTVEERVTSGRGVLLR
jgi:hypothetical protein